MKKNYFQENIIWDFLQSNQLLYCNDSINLKIFEKVLIVFGAKSLLLHHHSFIPLQHTRQLFCFKENINPSMDDTNEEFEPLFDYTRVQPRDIVCLDDDSEDASPVIFSKRRKISDAEASKKLAHVNVNVKDANVVNLDKEEDKEEDWLPPPPKSLIDSDKTLEEGSTLKALRLKKQELASFAQSAEELVQAVEESVRTSLQYSPQNATKQTLKPPHERTKLVISIQDKDELKQFRVYVDDKLERIFKMYADRIKLDVNTLVFLFDGDKISSTATPDSLGMEENDIIEVHVKSS